MNIDLAIGSYRHAVARCFGDDRVAGRTRSRNQEDDPSATRKTFLYNLSAPTTGRTGRHLYKPESARNSWRCISRRAKVGHAALAFERLTPKRRRCIWQASIRRLTLPQAAPGTGRGRLKLPNVNLDVGVQTRREIYAADAAYANCCTNSSHYPNCRRSSGAISSLLRQS